LFDFSSVKPIKNREANYDIDSAGLAQPTGREPERDYSKPHIVRLAPGALETRVPTTRRWREHFATGLRYFPATFLQMSHFLFIFALHYLFND